LLLIAVIFVATRGADNPVKGMILKITNPFLKTFRIFSGGMRGAFEFLGSIGDLKTENENLLKENQSLEAQIAKLKDTEKENELLRKELDLVPRKEYDLESGFVIGQDALGSGSVIFIDKGSNDGIKEGMAVIVSNGVLVGKTGEVYADTSKVNLIIDKESAVNGEILESGAKGIVKGTYGLGITMDMIGQTEVVKEGDTVIASGLGGGVPRGLFVGKIGQVGQSEDKLFQRATIFSSVDFSSLRIVFVIKNSK
jgi:rod shape-determining protein MreC